MANGLGGCEIAIIGGGIAGASAAWTLASVLGDGSAIVLLEQEDQPGAHATGRSAAQFVETYGPPVIRELTRASRAFLTAPPPGFADAPILRPLPMMMVAPDDQTDAFEAELREDPAVVEVPVADAVRRLPRLRAGVIRRAAIAEAAWAMDVDLLFQGYLRGFRRLGGRVLTGAVALGADGTDPIRVAVGSRAGSKTLSARRVINAAGAWADRVAALLGTAPLGIQPMRRTAAVVSLDPGLDPGPWPMVLSAAQTVYFKPEAGRLLVSPSDATPVEPHDAFADDLEVAIAVDRMQALIDVGIRRVDRSWAGLRSFAPDGVPVIGPDPARPEVIWCAGQGGYGIQTAPAMARALAHSLGMVADPPIAAAQRLSPARFQSRPAK